MQFPLSNHEKIQQRSDAIRFIYDHDFQLIIHSGQFEFIDHYLNLNISVLRNNFVDAYYQSISYKLKPSNDYYIIQSGVLQLLFLFKHLEEKISHAYSNELPENLEYWLQYILSFLKNQEIQEVLRMKEFISPVILGRLDNLFRKKFKIEVLEIVDIVYTLDAYMSVAITAKEKGLSFPEFLSDTNTVLMISGLFHPLLEKAVPYDVDFKITENLCFLTGPNMAGKSTLLKSVGVAIYLSHLGFPVPANKMKTTIYNGMITTINLSDNLNRGYSHFYSEVKRVKEAAVKIKERGKMFVIFDELFRGTNVKDAFDASLLIISSFSRIKDSRFYISTHITEIAKEIENIRSVQFRYLDSELINESPIYSYRLLKGVSHERLGMLILKNEKIVDILNSIPETNDLSDC